MKITDIKTAEVRGHGYSTYVRIFTDEGITGTGECIHGGDGAPRLVEGLKGMLFGEDPLNVDRLFEKMRRAHIFNGALAGNMVTAMVGIEIALWDIAGKALNVPVYRLLGGKFRDKVRIYVDCHAGKGDTPKRTRRKRVKSLRWASMPSSLILTMSTTPISWIDGIGQSHRARCP